MGKDFEILEWRDSLRTFNCTYLVPYPESSLQQINQLLNIAVPRILQEIERSYQKCEKLLFRKIEGLHTALAICRRRWRDQTSCGERTVETNSHDPITLELQR
jgi:hypothetical protein